MDGTPIRFWWVCQQVEGGVDTLEQTSLGGYEAPRKEKAEFSSDSVVTPRESPLEVRVHLEDPGA